MATSTATSTKTGKGKTKGKGNAGEEAGDDEAAMELGLPDECKADTIAGRSCLVCKPRILEVVQCASGEVEGFDPANQCQNNGEKVSCDIGGDERLALDLSEETGLEKLYNTFDIIILGVQAFLGGRLDDKPEAKAALGEVLAIVKENKDNLFMCGDIKPMVNDLGAVAQSYTGLDEAMVENFKGLIGPALALFPSVCKTVHSTQIGQLNGELMKALMGSFGAMGGGLGDLVSGLDAGSLQDLLAGLGQGDLDDLLGGGTKTSTATATDSGEGTGEDEDAVSTDTATSTATSTSTATQTATSTATQTATGT